MIVIIINILYFLANRVCGNDFTQHIPLRKPRRSQNKLKPIIININNNNKCCGGCTLISMKVILVLRFTSSS